MFRTLEPDIEKGVDAVRCAATRVRKSRQEAIAIKDASIRVFEEEDEWVCYQTAKRLWQRAEQVEEEARAGYQEASDLWRALPRPAFAARMAERAYQQANSDVNAVSQLVKEAQRNCTDACEGFF